MGMGTFGFLRMRSLCLALPVPCRASSPRDHFAPKEGLSPQRGLVLEPPSGLGKAPHSLAMPQQPWGPSQWRCGALGRFFPGKKLVLLGGRGSGGNLLVGRGFCHSDKDLCRHTRYRMILVLLCAGTNKSVHPLLRFIFAVRNMKGKKAKRLPILPDNLPVVEL